MTSREQIFSIPLHIKPNKQNDVPVVLRQSISRESFHKHPENDNKPKSEKVYGNDDMFLSTYTYLYVVLFGTCQLSSTAIVPVFVVVRTHTIVVVPIFIHLIEGT